MLSEEDSKLLLQVLKNLVTLYNSSITFYKPGPPDEPPIGYIGLDHMNKALKILEQHAKIDAIIVDLDGCLCPSLDRLNFLDVDDVDGFHAAGHKEKPSDWCLSIVKRFMPTHEILIVSARHIKELGDTREWLKKECGVTCPVFLNDTELIDFEFKSKVYNEQLKSKYNVLFVIDDNPRVVNMWRELGLVCLQPNHTYGEMK